MTPLMTTTIEAKENRTKRNKYLKLKSLAKIRALTLFLFLMMYLNYRVKKSSIARLDMKINLTDLILIAKILDLRKLVSIKTHTRNKIRQLRLVSS
jgi:hypothetical protein